MNFDMENLIKLIYSLLLIVLNLTSNSKKQEERSIVATTNNKNKNNIAVTIVNNNDNNRNKQQLAITSTNSGSDRERGHCCHFFFVFCFFRGWGRRRGNLNTRCCQVSLPPLLPSNSSTSSIERGIEVGIMDISIIKLYHVGHCVKHYIICHFQNLS